MTTDYERDVVEDISDRVTALRIHLAELAESLSTQDVNGGMFENISERCNAILEHIDHMQLPKVEFL